MEHKRQGLTHGLSALYRGLILSTLIVLFSPTSQGKILDKIVAVMDNQVITLSEVNRIGENIKARRNISPQIYFKEAFSDREIAKMLVHGLLIREKLGEIGYKIGDEQVEEQIRDTEARLNLNREALLKFLEGNNITFSEYFEIIRASIEINIFKARVITPLISITEQQIKNAFFNRNLTNKTFAFKYGLVNYTMNREDVPPGSEKNLPELIKKYQASGILPAELKGMQENELGNITEDGLTKDLVELLKKTNEGSLSEVIFMNNQFQVFWVKKKDLVESEVYLSAKNQIKEELSEIEVSKLMDLLLEKEAQKHFIKYFFDENL